jgi:hypothetical protein
MKQITCSFAVELKLSEHAWKYEDVTTFHLLHERHLITGHRGLRAPKLYALRADRLKYAMTSPPLSSGGSRTLAALGTRSTRNTKAHLHLQDNQKENHIREESHIDISLPNKP